MFATCFIELTTNLRETWDDDFVIAISNVKSRKKQSVGTVDILLAVKYDRSKKKLVLILDRRSKRGTRYNESSSFRKQSSLLLFLIPMNFTWFQ